MARAKLKPEAEGTAGAERVLIAEAQSDPRHFAELYDLNFDRVYAYVARRVDNRSEAEDVTSEVFHKALANLTRFEWRGAPFIAWLLRIAANEIANRRQRAVRERKRPLPQDPPAVRPTDIARAEQGARLHELVRQLPEIQRRVILLRFVLQKSIQQIALEIGRSEGAVKQLQFRAVKNLKVKMGGQHE